MRLTPRPAATLIELVVVLALGGTVCALMLSMVVRQQHFHTGAIAMVEGKRSARDATELLARELRPLATVAAARATHGSDIYTMSDSAITFRAHLGASVACAVDAARTAIVLPAPTGAINERLTTFLTLPRAGDSLFIFDRGATPSPNDDRWHRFALATSPSGGYCPLRPDGLAATEAEGWAGLTIQVTTPIPPGIDAGAPIRFFRPTTYSLYRTSTGDWALGSSVCTAGSCGVRQPVSGPYQPRSSAGPPGIVMQYFDASGAETNHPSAVARIDITTRTRSAAPLQLAHIRGTRYHDSLAITVAMRNRL